jgi:hypothetical protein
MVKSALLPNSLLIFLFLYFGLVIEGEEKYSFRQYLYILLILIDISILVYINRELILGYILTKYRKTETRGMEKKEDDVKDFIE